MGKPHYLELGPHILNVDAIATVNRATASVTLITGSVLTGFDAQEIEQIGTWLLTFSQDRALTPA